MEGVATRFYFFFEKGKFCDFFSLSKLVQISSVRKHFSDNNTSVILPNLTLIFNLGETICHILKPPDSFSSTGFFNEK